MLTLSASSSSPASLCLPAEALAKAGLRFPASGFTSIPPYFHIPITLFALNKVFHSVFRLP